MEVSGQLHAPASLPPGKHTLIPIGSLYPVSRSGVGGEEKNSQLQSEFEPPTIQQGYAAELSRFHNVIAAV
jgi:hypothetical protein